MHSNILMLLLRIKKVKNGNVAHFVIQLVVYIVFTVYTVYNIDTKGEDNYGIKSDKS